MKLFILDDDYAQLNNYKVHFPSAMLFWQIPTFRSTVRLNKPDILICDLVMPETDGWRMSDWVLELCPNCKVIIATSHEGDEQRILAESKGYGFWKKSADYESLKELVARHG